MVGGRLCHMVAHNYCCGVGGSWWSSKTRKKTNFLRSNKSVDGLQLGVYLADFGKWGTILIVTSCLTLSMPYFTSGGHFSDLLRCSKVRQLKVAIDPKVWPTRVSTKKFFYKVHLRKPLKRRKRYSPTSRKARVFKAPSRSSYKISSRIFFFSTSR